MLKRLLSLFSCVALDGFKGRIADVMLNATGVLGCNALGYAKLYQNQFAGIAT